MYEATYASLNMSSQAQVTCLSLSCVEVSRALPSSPVFLFLGGFFKGHFHPCLETSMKSYKLPTKTFPTVASINTSIHMHVRVDKETAFISSLNAEGRPETINIKNTFNFFISAETIKPYFQVDRSK